MSSSGTVTPSSPFTVTGVAVNTSISSWTYSVNGGSFTSSLPTGVTRSGNTVTINPSTSTFKTLTIKAADATVSDNFTIARAIDGAQGPKGDTGPKGSTGAAGADAYTVLLTNESHTFAGSTGAAVAGSTTTQVIAYKGASAITPSAISVGAKPTGMTSSVSGTTITFTVTSSMTSASGTVPITITVDGKTFTRNFSYAIAFKGSTGAKGDKGDKGDSGPGVVYQGDWDSGKTYYGNAIRRDIVKGTNEQYYICKSNHTSSSSNRPVSGSSWSSYWESFGAQFSSIATKLMLAEESHILNRLHVGAGGEIVVGENLEIGENKIVVEGGVSVEETTWITEDTYVMAKIPLLPINYSARTQNYDCASAFMHSLPKGSIRHTRYMVV